MRKLFTTVFLACLFIYSYANAAGLIPASVKYFGKPIKAAAIYDGTQAYIETSGIPLFGFSYSDSPNAQRVNIIEDAGQIISIPVVIVNNTRMVALNSLLRLNDTYLVWNETAKSINIYAKLNAIEFEADKLTIKCSVPVKYSVKNLGTKYIIDLPYTIVATEAREVPVLSDKISLIRIGQYQPDITRIAVDLKDKCGYSIESKPETEQPTIFFSNTMKNVISTQTKATTQPINKYNVNSINIEKNLDDGNPNVIIYTTAKGTAKAITSFNPNKITISLFNASIPDNIKIANTHPVIKDYVINNKINQIILNLNSPQLVSTQISDDRIVVQLKPFYGSGGDLTGKTIVIDPGHGGYDKGAKFGSVFEKDLNLQIASVLAKKLREIGANPQFTREDDTYIGLASRSQAAKDIEADFFISIHCNSNPTPGSATGIETYYHMQQPCDKALALSIHKNVCISTTMCDRKPRSDRSLYTTGLAVLRHLEGTTIPGVLLECGYINHNADRAFLKDPIFQAKLADGIIKGFNKYIAGDIPNE